MVGVTRFELATSCSRSKRSTKLSHTPIGVKRYFFVSGQTCGQTEDLVTFRHSGEPKKSVFSRGFGSSRKFYAECGDWVPKLARYHLRYASIIEKIRIWELANKDEFNDCSASLRHRRRSTSCHRKCGEARKEYTILLNFVVVEIVFNRYFFKIAFDILTVTRILYHNIILLSIEFHKINIIISTILYHKNHDWENIKNTKR